jgi:serine/threonine protein kinase
LYSWFHLVRSVAWSGFKTRCFLPVSVDVAYSARLLVLNRFYLDEVLAQLDPTSAVWRGSDSERKDEFLQSVVVKAALNPTDDTFCSPPQQMRNEHTFLTGVLSGLENIPRVIGFGEETHTQGPGLFLVEEPVGTPLDIAVLHLQRLSSGARRAVLLRWGGRLVEILQAVHGRQVIHGDIKPSNVVLTAYGELCLIDFGIAQIAPGTKVDGRVARTEPYASDGILRGEVPSFESDFVALAYTIHALDVGVTEWEEHCIHGQQPRPALSDLPRTGAERQLIDTHLFAFKGRETLLQLLDSLLLELTH